MFENFVSRREKRIASQSASMKIKLAIIFYAMLIKKCVKKVIPWL